MLIVRQSCIIFEATSFLCQDVLKMFNFLPDGQLTTSETVKYSLMYFIVFDGKFVCYQ